MSRLSLRPLSSLSLGLLFPRKTLGVLALLFLLSPPPPCSPSFASLLPFFFLSFSIVFLLPLRPLSFCLHSPSFFCSSGGCSDRLRPKQPRARWTRLSSIAFHSFPRVPFFFFFSFFLPEPFFSPPSSLSSGRLPVALSLFLLRRAIDPFLGCLLCFFPVSSGERKREKTRVFFFRALSSFFFFFMLSVFSSLPLSSCLLAFSFSGALGQDGLSRGLAETVHGRPGGCACPSSL